ncbi:MAG: beta strand repeat-containing protein, partial [Terriglobia bacterium]
LLAGGPRGDIVVQGSTLLFPTRTGPDETGLSLVGGNVSIGMDPDTGAATFVSAPSGTINLASASSPGEFLYPSLQTVQNIKGQSFTSKGTVSISDFANLDVSGSMTEGDGSGGRVRIVGGQFVMDNVSGIQNLTVGNAPGANPGISVIVDGDVRLDNLSSISVGTGSGTGRSGDLEVTAQNGKIDVLGASFFSSSSDGPAPAGNISMTAKESVTVAGVDPIFGSEEVSHITTKGSASLEGGNITITITGSTLSVRDDAVIATSSIDGRAGNITGSMDILNVLNGGRIASTTQNGSSGTITMTANESATISGQSAIGNFSGIANNSQTSPANIFITAGKFVLADKARIDGDTAFNQGGTVKISGTESISLSGDSSVRSSTTAGSGTSLVLSAPTIMFDQARLSTQISGADPTRVGGTIDVDATAGNLTVSNNTRITTLTTGGAQAGQAKLRAADSIFFTTGARVETSSTGSGEAGQQTLFANNLLSLTGAGTGLFSEASGLGSGGAILAQANHVSFSEGAIASAKSTGAGKAGSVTIEGTASSAQSVVIDGAGSGIFTTTEGTGAGGNINLFAQSVTVQNSGTLSAATSGAGDAGAIMAKVGILNLTGDASISSSSSATASGAAGSVTIQGLASPADSVTVTSSSLQTSAANTGRGGSIAVDAGTITLNNSNVSASVKDFDNSPGSTDSATSGLGNVTLTASSVNMTGGAINAETSGSRNAGNITLATTGNTVTLSGGSHISSSSTGTMANAGDAGSVTINAGNSFQSSGSTVATSAAQGQGGDITINAGQSVTLNNNSSISASSSGPGNAGDIVINAGQNYTSTNSSVTTEAANAGGGNITVKATDIVFLTNSQLSASVLGGSGGGGDITIDPQFVILQNSQILAQAILGTGGNISITTNLFLPDSLSIVDASSQFGVNGNVTIQSPISQAGGKIVPLSNMPLETTALLGQRCAALAAGGQFSSFVMTGRDVLPTEPGSWLTSPLTSLTPALSPGEREPSVSLSQGEREQIVSVRRLPAGSGAMQIFPLDVAGCGS